MQQLVIVKQSHCPSPCLRHQKQYFLQTALLRIYCIFENQKYGRERLYSSSLSGAVHLSWRCMAVILIIKQSSKAENSLQVRLCRVTMKMYHPQNTVFNVKNVISNLASCNEVLLIDLRPLMSLLVMYLSLFKNQRERRWCRFLSFIESLFEGVGHFRYNSII